MAEAESLIVNTESAPVEAHGDASAAADTPIAAEASGPSPPFTPQRSSSLKRRNSSTTEQPTKRARIEDEAKEADAERGLLAQNVTNDTVQHSLGLENGTDLKTASGLAQDEAENERALPDTGSRRRTRDDERKRGKRLFGGLLGTLSQSSTSSASRKRAEIEKKQQEKLKAQDEEREEDKKRRLENLAAQRRVQQKEWDVQAMRMRHSNQRALARMLSTRSEPKIYYLPYELSKPESETIKVQIEDVEDQISRELEDSQEHHHDDEADMAMKDAIEQLPPSADQSEPTYVDVDGSEQPREEPSMECEARIDDEHGITHDSSGDRSSFAEVEQAASEKPDENEDVTIEAGEDSVIY